MKPESMASDSGFPDTGFLTPPKSEIADLPSLRRTKRKNMVKSREGEDQAPLNGGRKI